MNECDDGFSSSPFEYLSAFVHFSIDINEFIINSMNM